MAAAQSRTRGEHPLAPSEPPDELSWTAEAACHGHAELFFPTFAERPQSRVKRETRARAICAACPVLVECRDHGRRNHEYGIWGGENEEERVLAGYALHAPIGTRHLVLRRDEPVRHASDGPAVQPLR
jgi:WhiB family redox-sensing transcriptional regulator